MDRPLAADESKLASGEDSLSPLTVHSDPVASIRRQHVQYALDELESHGGVTPAQRAVIETIAARVRTSLASAAIEPVRTARITASTPNE